MNINGPKKQEPKSEEAASAADEIRFNFKDTIQNRFFLILVAVFAAIFFMQMVIFFARYRDERSSEFTANLELAKAVAKRFEGFVQDVLHQELAIGIAITQNASPELINELLVQSKEEYGLASSFSWAEPSGRVIYSSLEGFVGVNIRDRNYFQKILNGADWSVSNLIFSRTSNRLIFTINRGIFNSEGELLGVMVVGIFAVQMDKIMAIDRTGKGMVHVLDRNGVALFGYPGYPWLLEKRRLIEEFPVIQGAFEGKEVMTTIEKFNEITDMVTAFVPVSAFGWVALAGRPHEEIVGPIFLDLLSHGMLFGFVVLLAFAAALFFSRKLTEPLIRLRKQAFALGKREKIDPIEIDGVAELETLAHALNRMALEINVREAKIERERERAEDLAMRLEQLVRISGDVLSATTMQGLLQKMVDAAREITGANLGTSGHGYVEGAFEVGATSRSSKTSPCPPGRIFKVERGGVYLDLISKERTLRLTHGELESHASWWGLPPGHAPLRGLLGASLLDREGNAKGLIMVSDKKEGEFTAEDEILISELALLASLGMQHIEARQSVEEQVEDRTRELVFLNEQLMREIEERKEIEDALDRQRELLQKIVDNIPVMVCFYDADDEIRIINREFENLLGWSSEDAKGKDLMAMLYPDPEYRKHAIRFMQNAEPGWRDFTVADRNGNTLHTSWANAKLSDGSRIGIGIDISWRIQVEQALKAYATQLEWSNRELQDFAFVASHDLQEPLRKIQAFGDLLRVQHEKELGEDGNDYLQRMQSAATRMRTLIDALLSYSRVTTKGQPFSRVDMEEIVREAVSNLEMRIEETGAHVEWKNLPEIEADPAQMMQIFQNLIGNGLKFNESDRPKIGIEGRESEGEEGPCEIRVGDNGIGFDEKYVDRIFSPFQRLHGRSEYEGTGMGLAICRKIVERHNGTITAQSRPQSGSTFIIRLPKRQEQGLSVPIDSVTPGKGEE